VAGDLPAELDQAVLQLLDLTLAQSDQGSQVDEPIARLRVL
jgi:hypothetical protein